jgi:hypothetical protein
VFVLSYLCETLGVKFGAYVELISLRRIFIGSVHSALSGRQSGPSGILCGPHGERRASRRRELAGARQRPSQGMRQDQVDCSSARGERLGVCWTLGVVRSGACT